MKEDLEERLEKVINERLESVRMIDKNPYALERTVLRLYYVNALLSFFNFSIWSVFSAIRYFFLYIRIRLELLMIKCAIIELVVGSRVPIGMRTLTIFEDRICCRRLCKIF